MITMTVWAGEKTRWVWHYWKNAFDEFWEWPNNIKLVWVCEINPPSWAGFETIATGLTTKEQWGKTFRGILQQINTDYILWDIDDMWINGKVDYITLNGLDRFMTIKNIDNVKLFSNEHIDMAKKENKILGNWDIANIKILEYRNSLPYPTSLQPSLWNRKTFINLLPDNYSMWDFEMKPTIDKNYKSACLDNSNSVFPYIETIRHGKIRAGREKYFNKRAKHE